MQPAIPREPPGASGSPCRPDDRSGLALLATLFVLSLIGILSAIALGGALISLRTSLSDYEETRAFYAAEAAAEASLMQLQAALRDGSLSDEDLASITPPTLEGFSFEGFEIRRVGEPRIETITDGPFSGLYALTQDVDVYAPATDRTNSMSAILLRAKAQAIPIFQFGVFYQGDLEVTNGPPMEFAGRVHANGNIYLKSDNAWYREPVTTAQKVFHARKDAPDTRRGVYIDDAAGEEVRLDFDSRSIPDPEAFKAESEEKFDSRLQTEAHGVQPLNLPLPAGVEPYELVRRREDDDSNAEQDVKFAWLADTRVIVELQPPFSSSSTVCNGPPQQGTDVMPRISVVRSGDRTVPSPAEMCAMFEWEWEAFFDGREWNMRDVLNVDLEAIAAWSGGAPDRVMEIIYLELTPPVASPAPSIPDIDGKGINPAVRVRRGRVLPNALTIATEWPLYVWGDYNSVEKKPAGLVADAVTVLSNAWEDGEHDELPDNYEEWEDDFERRRMNRTGAARTAVYAAILAGHSATPCDYQEPGCPGGFYGGGLENYPRFLESWGSGTTFEYRGSLISLWESRKVDGLWSGYYYVPPRRDWSFDMDFRDPELLPPGTPNVGNVVKSAFREAF